MQDRSGFKILLFILIGIFISNRAFTQPLADIRICIDAGHGGHTDDDRQIFLPNGIIYWESEGNFITSLHLKEILEDLGAKVKLTRSDNSDASDISLSERSEIANAFNADYFHSIHTNGGGGNYSLVLYKEVNGEAAFPFAREMGEIMGPDLQDLMKTDTNYVRGDHSFLGFNLGVLKFVSMPSTLSESSFHDLPEEGLRLKNDEYLKNYAWAIARSMLEYFEAGGFPDGRVGGVITDVTTGEVVNEVHVSCEPSGLNYTVDNNYNGFYAIGNLEPGNYLLHLNKPGYLETSINISIASNEYLDLDLTIQYFNNGFPNVDFYMLGLPAGAGEWISFNAEKSSDDGVIDFFLWDFGDGSDTDTGMIVTHKFDLDGTYDIMLTAIDDENNQSSITKTVHIITTAPDIPEMTSVTAHDDETGIKLRWKKNEEGNILAYHVYVSESNDFSDELLLASPDSSKDLLMLDDWGALQKPYYFRMKAENIAHKMSDYSDVYCLYKTGNISEGQKVLIVNGFNRMASYIFPTHDFVKRYAAAILELEEYDISSCSNHAVISEHIKLTDFDVLIWFLGDESTANETLNAVEQQKLSDYLLKGGKLFISGAETGWDLVAKGSEEDKAFYTQFLKAEYLSDGTDMLSPASGLPASGFDGLKIHFGEIYPEDFPDEIGPAGGSSGILTYNNGTGAGIKYKGTFGEGEHTGAIVNIGFPLESTESQTEIDLFIEKVMDFFQDVPSDLDVVINEGCFFELYPTYVLDQVDIHYRSAEALPIQIQIWSLAGQRLYESKKQISAINGTFSIPVSDLKKGSYLVKIQTPALNKTLQFIKL